MCPNILILSPCWKTRLTIEAHFFRGCRLILHNLQLNSASHAWFQVRPSTGLTTPLHMDRELKRRLSQKFSSLSPLYPSVLAARFTPHARSGSFDPQRCRSCFGGHASVNARLVHFMSRIFPLLTRFPLFPAPRDPLRLNKLIV